MAKISFESLVPEILPEVPGCMDTLIIHALRQAAEQFLTDSTAWRMTLDPQFVINGMGEYDIEVPYSYTRAVKLIWVEIDEHRVTLISDGHRVRPDGKKYCCMDAFGKSMIIAPTPTQKEPLTMRVALSILPTTVALDDTVIWQMYDALLNGAVARLQMMEGQEWSNPASGAQKEMLFREAIMKAKRRADNNGGSANRTVRYGGI